MSGWRGRSANRVVVHSVNLIFGVIGIFFIVAGYNTWAVVQPVAGGKTATGAVMSVANGESCGRGGCSPNWTPTIRFDPPGGAAHVFTGPMYNSQISVGQTVTVSYLPTDPAVAHDISASSGQGLFLIGFGVFAVIWGLGSFILGLGFVHRRVGVSSTPTKDWWVGHRQIHSNQVTVLAVAVVVALLVVGFLVI
jgi:hypothetical protein